MRHFSEQMQRKVAVHVLNISRLRICCTFPRQVEKHREKLQKEKEVVVLEKLRLEFPGLPLSVMRLASQEVDWDEGPAAALLGRFQEAAKIQLASLAEVSSSILCRSNGKAGS